MLISEIIMDAGEDAGVAGDDGGKAGANNEQISNPGKKKKKD